LSSPYIELKNCRDSYGALSEETKVPQDRRRDVLIGPSMTTKLKRSYLVFGRVVAELGARRLTIITWLRERAPLVIARMEGRMRRFRVLTGFRIAVESDNDVIRNRT